MKEQEQARGPGVSKPDLAAIRKRYEAATPPPWEFEDNFKWQADREFANHAREDLPAVVEALEEARVLLKEIVNAKPARLKAAVFAAEKYLGESK